MLKHFPLHKIDFDYGYDETLFHVCFQPLAKWIAAKWIAEDPEIKTMLSFEEIRKQTKDNFWFLIKVAQEYEVDLSRILARPNGIGETVFRIAYMAFPELSTIKLFVDNNVEINHVTLEFGIPFPRPEHALFFVQNFINLKIIGLEGRSPLMELENFNAKNSISFLPSMQRLIKILPNSVYFSTYEQMCPINCPARVQI